MTHLALIVALLASCSVIETIDPLPTNWGNTYTCTIAYDGTCPIAHEQHSGCVTTELDAADFYEKQCDQGDCVCIISCDVDFFPCYL